MAKSNEIDISNLTSELGVILMQYTNNVSDEVVNWMEEAAKETSKNVKKYAQSAGFDNMGSVGRKYIKDWSYKKDGTSWVVYNKKSYRLAHLLEKGHDIIRNGHKIGRSPAFPHIKYAEEDLNKMVDELEKRLSEVKV